jgi:hypothetical protein
MDVKKYISEGKQAITRFKSTKDNLKKRMILFNFEMKWSALVEEYIHTHDDEEVEEIRSDVLYLPSTVSLSKEEDVRWIEWLNKEPQSSYIDREFERLKVELNTEGK